MDDGSTPWHNEPMRRILLVVALVACSSKKEEAPPVASGSTYRPLGNKPANARRPTAPPGIEASALAVGAEVPADIELTDASRTPWRLADALSKHTRVMVFFYRGDW